MARKAKCPQCGAKNAGDAPRCRICGALMNADAVEASLTAGEARPPTDDQLPHLGYDVKPATVTNAPPVIVREEHFDPNELELPWTHNLPPPPTKDDPVDPDFEHFDPNELQIGSRRDPRPSS